MSPADSSTNAPSATSSRHVGPKRIRLSGRALPPGVAVRACSPRQRLRPQHRTRARIASHHTHRRAADRDCPAARQRSLVQADLAQAERAAATSRAPTSPGVRMTRPRRPREHPTRPPAPGRTRAGAHRRNDRGQSLATPPRRTDVRTRSDRSRPRPTALQWRARRPWRATPLGNTARF
jgi:hypothetical protein